MFISMAGGLPSKWSRSRFSSKVRASPDPAYNVFTDDELSRMLNAARSSNYRDYVMLAVMAGRVHQKAEPSASR